MQAFLRTHVLKRIAQHCRFFFSQCEHDIFVICVLDLQPISETFQQSYLFARHKAIGENLSHSFAIDIHNLQRTSGFFLGAQLVNQHRLPKIPGWLTVGPLPAFEDTLPKNLFGKITLRSFQPTHQTQRSSQDYDD